MHDMTMTETQELMGAPGSPYTRKMLAYLRFRNIPYRFEINTNLFQQSTDKPRNPERPRPKVQLLPTFYFPSNDASNDTEGGDQQAVTDSTWLIERFESQIAHRSTTPSDERLQWLNLLLEDYADEWLTKAMFHYRWTYPDDIEQAAQILPRWSKPNTPEPQVQKFAEMVTERQIARLSYVGSNTVTLPVIEDSFKRYMKLLDQHLTEHRFLLGDRPAACDFATYGQLTCLALFDPTPSQWILQNCPRIYAWTSGLEDLSGYGIYDDDWINFDDIPETLIALLTEIGALYVPYLFANDSAVQRRDPQVDTEVNGQRWQQTTFPYHSKCLKWLREYYANNLSETQRASYESLLGKTKLDQLI